MKSGQCQTNLKVLMHEKTVSGRADNSTVIASKIMFLLRKEILKKVTYMITLSQTAHWM